VPLPLAMSRAEDEPIDRTSLNRFAKQWTRKLRSRIHEIPGLNGQYCMVLAFDGGWQIDVCCDDDKPVSDELRALVLEACPLELAPRMDAALEVLVNLNS